MSATARKWGPLRQALLPEMGCKAATNGLLDIGSGTDQNMKFKSKSEMCRDHQVVLALLSFCLARFLLSSLPSSLPSLPSPPVVTC